MVSIARRMNPNSRLARKPAWIKLRMDLAGDRSVDRCVKVCKNSALPKIWHPQDYKQGRPRSSPPERSTCMLMRYTSLSRTSHVSVGVETEEVCRKPNGKW